MNLTRRGSLPFGWKVAAFCLTVAGLSALKFAAGEVFASVMAFVSVLILLCAVSLTSKS